MANNTVVVIPIWTVDRVYSLAHFDIYLKKYI